ncbi:hypothetical protein C8Q79DRAFT_518115 [Trametes meyenii]|nr:hypothetical protein C8Q79DRAFT_518115 [Trametes meyenii]
MHMQCVSNKGEVLQATRSTTTRKRPSIRLILAAHWQCDEEMRPSVARIESYHLNYCFTLEAACPLTDIDGIRVSKSPLSVRTVRSVAFAAGQIRGLFSDIMSACTRLQYTTSSFPVLVEFLWYSVPTPPHAVRRLPVPHPRHVRNICLTHQVHRSNDAPSPFYYVCLFVRSTALAISESIFRGPSGILSAFLGYLRLRLMP